MIKRTINKVNDRLEDGLRGLLGRLTPDGRVILIVTIFVFFSGLSVYMTVSSIYNFGKKKRGSTGNRANRNLAAQTRAR